MVTKLYPPYIEGTIPAFYTERDKDSGEMVTLLKVPFSLNRAVGANTFCGFALKIRSVQTNVIIGTALSFLFKFEENNQLVIFDVSDISFTPGQSYKIQIAFIDKEDEETIGFYSDIGVVKYTTKPSVYIKDLEAGQINNHFYDYMGIYSQDLCFLKAKDVDKNNFNLNKYYTYNSSTDSYLEADSFSSGSTYYTMIRDASEKMYSSRFILFNKDQETIMYDSGERIHNNSEDTENFLSFEKITIEKELVDNESYYLQFIVTTSSKMKIKSNLYRIMQTKTIKPDIEAELKAKLCFDDAYIDLYLTGTSMNENGVENPQSGRFVICRAASNEDYAWHRIGTFTLHAEPASRRLWRDYTIEQGVTYQYSIQQYNDYKLYSDRIVSKKIVADFEDAFLFDGNKQLKIRFNPKVSSFKKSIQESKTDTIGSKYPFISRNGNVEYIEFPLSGLISHLQDDNQLFMTNAELGIKYKETDITTENIAAERKFKKTVLDWLNNGKMKLFKSPGEGNYIVRLMNTSLSPTDTVGRMLHTFSSTAYEMENFNYENLRKLGFISTIYSNDIIEKWKSINLATHSEELDNLILSLERYIKAGLDVNFGPELYGRVQNGLNENQLVEVNKFFNGYTLKNNASSLAIGYIKKLYKTLTFATNKVNNEIAYSIEIRDMLPGTIVRFDNETILIGNSGYYQADFENGIQDIIIPNEQEQLQKDPNYFRPMGIITYSYKVKEQSRFEKIDKVTFEDIPAQLIFGWDLKENLLDTINNSKRNITSFFRIAFKKKEIVPIFDDGTQKYYLDMDCQVPLDMTRLDDYLLYAICNRRTDYTYQIVMNEGRYIDANYFNGYYVNERNNRVKIFKNVFLDGHKYNEHLKDSTVNFLIPDFAYSTTVAINDDEFIVDKYFILNEKRNDIISLRIGNGIICDLSYQIVNTSYTIEETNSIVRSYSKAYEIAQQKLIQDRLNGQFLSSPSQLEEFDNLIDEDITDLNVKYNELLDALDLYIKEE